MRDANALDTPDLIEALRRARAQATFVFWNHPGFRVPKAEWFAPVAAAHEQKLFQGMELVNELTNVHVGAGRNLVLRVPLTIEVRAPAVAQLPAGDSSISLR